MNARNYLKYRIMDELLFSKASFCKCKKIYEEFLLNIVNSSRHFLNKLKYESPICESHGECDCISTCYELDFKLLISNSYMEGKSIALMSYTYISEGVRLGHPGGKEPQKKDLGLIHKQLMQPYICEGDKGDKHDFNSLREILKRDKNLLLFLPYRFSFDGNELFNENDINNILSTDICAKLVEFRKDFINKYDTYFVYLFNEYVIISKIIKNVIQFVEKNSLEKNKIYNLVYKRA